MTLPPGVNAQITDAAQPHVKVVSEAPAQAMTSLHERLAHSVGTVFEHAVSAPPSPATLAQAGAIQAHSAGTTAGTVEKIAQAGATDNLASLLTVPRAFEDNTPTVSLGASLKTCFATAQRDTSLCLKERLPPRRASCPRASWRKPLLRICGALAKSTVGETSVQMPAKVG